MRKSWLLAVGLVLVCLFLTSAGCNRSEPPADSRNADATTGTAETVGPFVANPPRLDSIPADATITVSIGYDKLRFPIGDRDALSASLVQAINRKLERFGMRAVLSGKGGETAGASGSATLTIRYSEEANTLLRVHMMGDESKTFTPTECLARLEMKAPWLSHPWRTSVSGQRTLGQITKPLQSDKDLRDMSHEDLCDALFRVSLPVGKKYAGAKSGGSVTVGLPFQGMGIAQQGNLIAVTDPDHKRLCIYRSENGGRPSLVASSYAAEFNGYPLFAENGLLAVGTAGGSVKLFNCSLSGKLLPLSTVKLGRSNPDMRTQYDLAFQDGRLYVLGDGKLVSVDVKKPAAPIRGPEIESDGSHIGAVESGVLCLTSIGALSVFRSGGSGLSELGSCGMELSYHVVDHVGVAIRGDYAYVPYGADSSVLCFDISDPSNPVEAGKIHTSGYPADVAVCGDRLLIADGEAGICVVDVSKPTAPTVLGQIAVVGGVEYIACGDRSFACLAQSVFASPDSVMKLMVFQFQ